MMDMMCIGVVVACLVIVAALVMEIRRTNRMLQFHERSHELQKRRLIQAERECAELQRELNDAQPWRVEQ